MAASVPVWCGHNEGEVHNRNMFQLSGLDLTRGGVCLERYHGCWCVCVWLWSYKYLHSLGEVSGEV